MNPIIETRQADVAVLCRRFLVRRLDVFGSATRADFDPNRSDLDLLVEFEPDTAMKALNQYVGFKHALEALFERPVDLIVASALENPYIRRGIEESRETLYAA